jgi:hypothetical protein
MFCYNNTVMWLLLVEEVFEEEDLVLDSVAPIGVVMSAGT